MQQRTQIYIVTREYLRGGEQRDPYAAVSDAALLRRLADELEADSRLTDPRPMGPILMLRIFRQE